MNNLLWAAAARVPIGVTEPNVDLVSGGGYVSYWALIAVACIFCFIGIAAGMLLNNWIPTRSGRMRSGKPNTSCATPACRPRARP